MGPTSPSLFAPGWKVRVWVGWSLPDLSLWGFLLQALLPSRPFVPPFPPHPMTFFPGDKTHPLAPRTEAAASPQGPPHGPIHLAGSLIQATGEGTLPAAAANSSPPAHSAVNTRFPALAFQRRGPPWLLRPRTQCPGDPHSDPGRRWAGSRQTPGLPLSILRPPCLNKGAAAAVSQLAGGEGPAVRPGFS